MQRAPGGDGTPGSRGGIFFAIDHSRCYCGLTAPRFLVNFGVEQKSKLCRFYSVFAWKGARMCLHGFGRANDFQVR